MNNPFNEGRTRVDVPDVPTTLHSLRGNALSTIGQRSLQSSICGETKFVSGHHNPEVQSPRLFQLYRGGWAGTDISSWMFENSGHVFRLRTCRPSSSQIPGANCCAGYVVKGASGKGCRARFAGPGT